MVIFIAVIQANSRILDIEGHSIVGKYINFDVHEGVNHIQWPTPSHVYFLSVGLQAGVLHKEFVLLIKSSLITNKKEAIGLNI